MSKKRSSQNKTDVKQIDYVSQDKDWRGVVENELRCADNWNNDWGFLAEINCKILIFLLMLAVDTATTRDQKIQQIEEKLKMMDDVKIISAQRQSFKGGNLDERITSNNKLKTSEIQPFSRRPMGESKAHVYKKEKLGDDYKTKPYDNFLGSK